MNSLQLDPQSLAFTVIEILVLMAFIAFIGWLFGRGSGSGRISLLREELTEKQAELEQLEQYAEEPSFGTPNEEIGVIPTANVEASYPIESAPDDLKRIEGIGPRIEALLKEEGIDTFADLAAISPGRLSNLLRQAGPRFQMHDPTSWPAQAALARDGQWENLLVMQEALIAGQE